MSIQPGQPAPAFTLLNTDKQKVSLSDLRGKNVVLLFFPLAFTSVCTAELCNVRDNISLYNNVDAEVFGISVDSLFVLNKFKQEQHLNFQLLSDFNKTASRDYGVLYDVSPIMDMEGVSKRAVFVIDKEGIVRYTEVTASTGDQINFEGLQQAISALK